MSVDPKDVTLVCTLPRAVPADTGGSLVHLGSPGTMSGFSRYPFFGGLADSNDTAASCPVKLAVQSLLFLSEGRKT